MSMNNDPLAEVARAYAFGIDRTGKEVTGEQAAGFPNVAVVVEQLAALGVADDGSGASILPTVISTLTSAQLAAPAGESVCIVVPGGLAATLAAGLSGVSLWATHRPLPITPLIEEVFEYSAVTGWETTIKRSAYSQYGLVLPVLEHGQIVSGGTAAPVRTSDGPAPRTRTEFWVTLEHGSTCPTRVTLRGSLVADADTRAIHHAPAHGVHPHSGRRQTWMLARVEASNTTKEPPALFHLDRATIEAAMQGPAGTWLGRPPMRRRVTQPELDRMLKRLGGWEPAHQRAVEGFGAAFSAGAGVAPTAPLEFGREVLALAAIVADECDPGQVAYPDWSQLEGPTWTELRKATGRGFGGFTVRGLSQRSGRWIRRFTVTWGPAEARQRWECAMWRSRIHRVADRSARA